MNLGVALPVLLASMWSARRGSLLGLLLWPGAVFYVLYTYALYLIGAPLGPLFLGYVLQQLGGVVPTRTIGGILVALALLTVAQVGGRALAATHS